MPETAKLRYYRISDCGFFRHGVDDPDFGTAPEVFDDFNRWVSQADMEVIDTKTFEADADRDQLPVYCIDILPGGGRSTWLLTTWNETATDEGTFASINKHSTVGAPQIQRQDVPADGIPGYASYFWVFPRNDLVISIMFGTPQTGQRGLQLYLQQYLAWHSSWAHTAENPNNDEEIIIEGYSPNGDGPPEPFYPRLNLERLRSPTQVDRLRRNPQLISKMLQKKTLRQSSRTDRRAIGALLALLGLVDGRAEEHDAKFRSELEYTPTLEELDRIIEAYQVAADASASEDVGFKLTGEPEIIWLSHTNTKATVSLDVERDAQGIIISAPLLRELEEKRSQVVRPARSLFRDV